MIFATKTKPDLYHQWKYLISETSIKLAASFHELNIMSMTENKYF